MHKCVTCTETQERTCQHTDTDTDTHTHTHTCQILEETQRAHTCIFLSLCRIRRQRTTQSCQQMLFSWHEKLFACQPCDKQKIAQTVFSTQTKVFSNRKRVLACPGPQIVVSCPETLLSCQEMFPPQKVFSCRKKMVACPQMVFSCQESMFSCRRPSLCQQKMFCLVPQKVFSGGRSRYLRPACGKIAALQCRQGDLVLGFRV
jgi:hypothetical protein